MGQRSARWLGERAERAAVLFGDVIAVHVQCERKGAMP
jgi:hypothetical protein